MKKIFFFFILSISMGQIVPNSDPLKIFLKKDFLLNHNLQLYAEPFPFSINNYPETVVSFPGKNMLVRANPELEIFRDIPVTIYQGWTSATFGPWSDLVVPALVPDRYGEELLGAGFSRFNLSGRFTSALIRYQNDHTVFQMGRGPVWWGQSWESSIIQSGQSPPYDHADLRIRFSAFQLEILSGQLGSGILDTQRIKRNIAGHRLVWTPKTMPFVLSLGEQIIYTGVNRGLEWVYLNPAIPYVFTAFEQEEENNRTGTDNDNSIIFITGRYVFTPARSVFFEFIIDDYQIDKNNIPNALGGKLGLDGAETLRGKLLTYDLEYTRIGSWTYLHPGEFTTWQNLSHPVGFKYGPDSWAVELQTNTWLRDNLAVAMDYTYLRKGANNLGTQWNPYGTRGAPFPSRPLSDFQYVKFSLSWYSRHVILESGFSSFPVVSEELNGLVPRPRSSLFVKIQYIYGMGFAL